MSDTPVDVSGVSRFRPEDSAVGSATQSSCRTCGAQRIPGDVNTATSSFVYAIGRLEPRFPTLGVEKELAQAIGKAGTAKLTDREAMHSVLSGQEYFYLVRQLCWV